jgi:tetratricopeptide (TPR) repeat protein
MLRPTKKISKKEIKQDKLVTTYVQVTNFYQSYKRQINIGIVVVVAVVIAGVVYVKNRADNHERALTQLSAVQSLFDSGQFQSAIDGVPERNIVGLKSIVDNYGGSPGGDLARFYLADAYFQLGKYQEALEQFKDCSPSDDLLKGSRDQGIASCYEALGDAGEAAEYFEASAARQPTEEGEAEQLANAARNYDRAGDTAKALEIYNRLKKNFPTTTPGREADRHITRLSV